MDATGPAGIDIFNGQIPVPSEPPESLADARRGSAGFHLLRNAGPEEEDREG